MSSPTFIVSTGRCGSTMLSNMLHRHPAILSLSEFFTMLVDIGGRIPQAFQAGEIDGREFWSLISAVTPRLSLMLRHGLVMPEVLYPCHSATARFSAQTGVPVILQTTLPHLTDQHDALYAELEAVVVAQPAATLPAHYAMLFGWLQQRFGRQLWVERSGGMFVMIEFLHQFFPDARFIHLARDGRDTALSMSRHIGFRMYLMSSQISQLMGVDPYESPDRTQLERLPPELQCFLPEQFNPDALRHFPLPVASCGQLWSQMVQQGLGVLGQIPPERVLHLRYEDFLTRPKVPLARLAAFLCQDTGEDVGQQRTESWLNQTAAMVRAPQSSWRDLPASEAETLALACAPGFEVLRAHDLCWD